MLLNRYIYSISISTSIILLGQVNPRRTRTMTQGSQDTSNSASALEAVLSNIAQSGLEEAITKFGSGLSDNVKNLLRALSPEELSALAKVNELKLGAAAPLGNQNNNN